MNKVALVVTSISKPNTVLQLLADGACRHGWDFILAGDVSSPKEFSLASCDYYDIERQISTGLGTARKCLTRHYARKNVGYLAAIRKGAQVIVETDDDNVPLESFWQERVKTKPARFVQEKGWLNVYRHFSNAPVWPRGFPLASVQRNDISLKDLTLKTLDCPVQQGLADDNPDVDAVYRLLMPLPIRFKPAEDLALGAEVWSPFNSQNTTWWLETFPLLYLPSYCSFRMTDIWRSLIAQRIAWANGWSVLFHQPTVRQERNEHNLMKDFADEVSGYLQVELIRETLTGLIIPAGVKNIPQAMRRCYASLVEKNVFDPREIDLLEAWLEDLR